MIRSKFAYLIKLHAHWLVSLSVCFLCVKANRKNYVIVVPTYNNVTYMVLIQIKHIGYIKKSKLLWINIKQNYIRFKASEKFYKY